MGKFFFFTKCMANDDFSELPRSADSKNPIISLGVHYSRTSRECHARAEHICPYPPFSPICLTLGQFVNGGSAVKFRGTRGGTSAAKNVKNFTAEAP